MSAPANCQLVGRWRIVEADIWDRDYLNLCGPATIKITAEGSGEIASGALQVGLIEYSRSSIAFTWGGFDEMDEVSGDGSAELPDDGSIEIEFGYHNGDQAVLKAKSDTSSTACWASRRRWCVRDWRTRTEKRGVSSKMAACGSTMSLDPIRAASFAGTVAGPGVARGTAARRLTAGLPFAKRHAALFKTRAAFY